jgi:hypothetical protein
MADHFSRSIPMGPVQGTNDSGRPNLNLHVRFFSVLSLAISGKLKNFKAPHFPMNFRTFLRRMFGGRLHADRLHLYRKYLFASIRVEHWFKGRSATEEERELAIQADVEKVIAKNSQEGFKDPQWYFELEDSIKRWRVANRVNQRREAARARWSKKKPIDKPDGPQK